MYTYLNILLAFALNLPIFPMSTVYATAARLTTLNHTGPSILRPNYTVQLGFDTRCSGCTSFVGYTVTVRDSSGNVEESNAYEMTFMNIASVFHSIGDPKKENETKRTINVTTWFTKNTTDPLQTLSLNIFYELPFTARISGLYSYATTIPTYSAIFSGGATLNYYENYIFDRLIDITLTKMLIDPTKMGFEFWYTNYVSTGLYTEETFMLINDIYAGSDIPKKDNSFYIPLRLKCKTTTCSFELENEYFYDQVDKMLYISNGANRRSVRTLTIPPSYAGKSITFEIHLVRASAMKHTFIIRSTFFTSLNPFGDCENSYYCMTSISEPLKDVEYNQRGE